MGDLVNTVSSNQGATMGVLGTAIAGLVAAGIYGATQKITQDPSGAIDSFGDIARDAKTSISQLTNRLNKEQQKKLSNLKTSITSISQVLSNIHNRLIRQDLKILENYVLHIADCNTKLLNREGEGWIFKGEGWDLMGSGCNKNKNVENFEKDWNRIIEDYTSFVAACQVFTKSVGEKATVPGDLDTETINKVYSDLKNNEQDSMIKVVDISTISNIDAMISDKSIKKACKMLNDNIKALEQVKDANKNTSTELSKDWKMFILFFIEKVRGVNNMLSSVLTEYDIGNGPSISRIYSSLRIKYPQLNLPEIIDGLNISGLLVDLKNQNKYIVDNNYRLDSEENFTKLSSGSNYVYDQFYKEGLQKAAEEGRATDYISDSIQGARSNARTILESMGVVKPLRFYEKPNWGLWGGRGGHIIHKKKRRKSKKRNKKRNLSRKR